MQTNISGISNVTTKTALVANLNLKLSYEVQILPKYDAVQEKEIKSSEKEFKIYNFSSIESTFGTSPNSTQLISESVYF